MLKKVLFSYKIYLILIAFFLSTFQTVNIRVFGSFIEVSVLILFTLFLLMLLLDEINQDYIYFILSITLVFILYSFFFDITPYYRVLSIYISIASISYFFFHNNFKASIFKKIFYYLILSSFFSAFILLFQYFTYMNSSSLRPIGLFLEPTFAGLLLYSLSSAFLFMFFQKMIKHRSINIGLIVCFLGFLFFFICGFLTESTHFFTLLISLGIILGFIIFKKIKLNYLYLIFKFGILAVSVIILILLIDNKILNKVNIFSEYNMHDLGSLSLSVWLQGFEMMLSSLNKSLFGLGPGSVGYIDFYSYQNKILTNNNYYLNLTDAYSLFFRIIIEFGIFSLVFFYFIYNRLIIFINLILNNNLNFYQLFLFVFSFAIIIGSLLKEPNYYRSTLVFALFIFCIFNSKNEK